MGRNVIVSLYALLMVAEIIGVDLAFFRNRFFERLVANVGIVLPALAFTLGSAGANDRY